MTGGAGRLRVLLRTGYGVVRRMDGLAWWRWAALTRALVLLRRGSYGRAEGILLRLHDRSPHTEQLSMILVALSDGSGNQALAPAQRRRRAAATRTAASRAIRDRRWADAVALAEDAVVANPWSSWCRSLLAVARRNAGDLPGAAAAIREACALSAPGRFQREHRLILRELQRHARALNRERRFAEALPAAERLVLLEPDSTRALAALSTARAGAGDLTGGINAIELACRLDPANDGYRSHKRRLEGRLRLLSGAWLPELRGARERLEPASGRRVLHLLERTMPYRQSGYTLRSRYTVEAQRAIGLEPVVASRLGFPAIDGVHRFDRVESLGSVDHHRLTRPEVENYLRLPHDIYVRLYAREAARLVERVRPAVVHPAMSYYNGMVGLALKQRYGIPMVYEVRGFQWDTWASEHPGGEWTDQYQGRIRAELQCMLGADRVVTLAEVMKRGIVAWGVPEDRVAVIPNAVDHRRFAPRPRDPALARALDLDGKVVLGYVTGLVAYEGVDVLLRATALLAARGVPVACLVVGDGPSAPGLRRLVAELGIEREVRLTGRVPHDRVTDYYSLIDVFVVPRRDLPVCRAVTPLKPFEAMAMGIPLLVSDLPALREIAKPGERGLAFVPEDPGDLAEQATRLVLDPGLRARLGDGARTWVVGERTWTRNAERYRDLYSELLDRPRVALTA